MSAPIGVFLVDDSPTARLGLRRMVESAADLTVVGEVSSGRAALREIPERRPDIVLMDVAMPGLDGLETTRRLMCEHPVPIVLISDLVGRRAELNFQALEAGALDLLRKPTRAELEDPVAQAALTRRLRILAPVPLVTRRGRAAAPPRPRATPPVRPFDPASPRATAAPSAPALAASPPPPAERRIERLSVGASTGGPVAVARLLAGLGGRAPWPIAVVQHISAGFVAGMAGWLQAASGLTVEVVDGSVPRAMPGRVYLAGDDRHLVWDGPGLRTAEEPADTLHRPAIDVLLRSAAADPRPARHAGVLLTGMGRDGALGLLELRRAGGTTVAQSEESCVVYGMPRAAAEIGAAETFLPVEEMAGHLLRLSSPEPT